MAADERPSFESIYMDLARTLANRSTCIRLNVGTVITSTDYRKVLAVGYNGNATGLPNQCDR
ncbi:MAG: cytidine deaminase, partial [bacterium]|nr:cytidine deaminase [bacterium]